MMRSTPRKHPVMSGMLIADSCGCAMGARFMGAALVASVGWFVWHWREYSLRHASVRILIFAFAAAAIGKLVGIALYRLRARGLREIFNAITRHSAPAAP